MRSTHLLDGAVPSQLTSPTATARARARARSQPPPPPYNWSCVQRSTTQTGFPTLQHANAAATKPQHTISHHEAADHAVHAPPPAPYPNAPPPAKPICEMSARAKKKFQQLDLDSSGYMRLYICLWVCVRTFLYPRMRAVGTGAEEDRPMCCCVCAGMY